MHIQQKIVEENGFFFFFFCQKRNLHSIVTYLSLSGSHSLFPSFSVSLFLINNNIAVFYIDFMRG